MNMNMISTISKSMNPQTGKTKTRNKFHTSSSTTSNSNFTFPETAPLIFPYLHSLSQDTNTKQEQKFKEKFKSKSEFVSDYMDRRARAQYAAQNPDSFLSTGPKDKFTSRYADPSHPASSGNPWSLVTGGKFNPPMGTEFVSTRMGGGRGGFGGRGAGLGGLGAVLGGGRGEMGGRRSMGDMVGWFVYVEVTGKRSSGN